MIVIWTVSPGAAVAEFSALASGTSAASAVGVEETDTGSASATANAVTASRP